MTCIAIFRNTLQLNAAVINALQADLAILRVHAAAHLKAGNTAFFIDTNDEAAKVKATLAKKVALQKRVKVEIAAIFRNERIARKYELVFGKAPAKQQTTSYEQEAMLDALLKEKQIKDSASAELASTQVVKTA